MDPFIATQAASFLMEGVGALFGHNEAKKVARENRRLAQASAANQRRSLSLRKYQERMKAARALRDIERASGTQQGAVRASAAAGGVSGQSVDLQGRDVERSALEAASDVRFNFEAIREQLDAEARRIDLELRSRLNNNESPSFLPTALNIGRAGIESGTSIYTFKERQKIREERRLMGGSD